MDTEVFFVEYLFCAFMFVNYFVVLPIAVFLNEMIDNSFDVVTFYRVRWDAGVSIIS